MNDTKAVTVKPLPVWLRHHVAKRFKRSASALPSPLQLGPKTTKTLVRPRDKKKNKEAPLGIS